MDLPSTGGPHCYLFSSQSLVLPLQGLNECGRHAHCVRLCKSFLFVAVSDKLRSLEIRHKLWGRLMWKQMKFPCTIHTVLVYTSAC